MKSGIIKNFLFNQDGQAMTEYVLATVFITFVFITSMRLMSDAIKNVFSSIIDNYSRLINFGVSLPGQIGG